MMSDSVLIKSSFNEVVLANFGDFQIAVPSYAQNVTQYLFSNPISIPKRIYSSTGWLISQQQIIALIQNLKIELIAPDNSPFQIPTRLAPGVPVSFEARSEKALPQEVTIQACLVCQLPEDIASYCSVFGKIKPRFSRLFPFADVGNLIESVQEMLRQEQRFIQENREQLRNVPFYKNSFGL